MASSVKSPFLGNKIKIKRSPEVKQEKCSQKMIVVLDMDHTLLFCEDITEQRNNLNYTYREVEDSKLENCYKVITTDAGTRNERDYRIHLRPGLEHFLKELDANELIIPFLYTAGNEDYTSKILESIPLMRRVFKESGYFLCSRDEKNKNIFKTLDKVVEMVQEQHQDIENIKQRIIIFDDKRFATWDCINDDVENEFAFIQVKPFFGNFLEQHQKEPRKLCRTTVRHPDPSLESHLEIGDFTLIQAEGRYLFNHYYQLIKDALEYEGPIAHFVAEKKRKVFENQRILFNNRELKAKFKKKSVELCFRGVENENRVKEIYRLDFHNNKQRILYGKQSMIGQLFTDLGGNLVNHSNVVLTAKSHTFSEHKSRMPDGSFIIEKAPGLLFKEKATELVTDEFLIIDIKWLRNCVYLLKNLPVDEYIYHPTTIEEQRMLYKEDYEYMTKIKLESTKKRYNFVKFRENLKKQSGELTKFKAMMGKNKDVKVEKTPFIKQLEAALNMETSNSS